MKTCMICEKGTLAAVEDIILDVSGYVFIAKGERCGQCHEEIPYEDETRRMINAAKKLGVWPEPLKLYRHLSRSSGGLILRIPSDIERQLELDEHGEIAISKVGNKIIIETEG
ncbi:hypothetical protein HYU19_03625 [Candidatus Woesearchaeota archaeon]|nr:hypothetical protein [Candidatus Woesearchaeota archaeon]